MNRMLGGRAGGWGLALQPASAGNAPASASAPAPRSTSLRLVVALMNFPLQDTRGSRLFGERLVHNQAFGPDLDRGLHRHHEPGAVRALDLDDVAGPEILDRRDRAEQAPARRDAGEPDQVGMIIFAVAQRRQRRARDGEGGAAPRPGGAAGGGAG